jgi:hypothetical protein
VTRHSAHRLNAAEIVVLVHGLWVHGKWMLCMQRRITHCGYRALCFSYPSMRCTLEDNVARLSAYCAAFDHDVVHLVGHSLGGLVALYAAAGGYIVKPGRVVLAGTPFAQSYSAQRLSNLPGGHALLGKSARNWLEPTPQPHVTGVEVGVIAGDLSFGLGRVIAPDLPPPNDGVVQVHETRVPGMRDHIVLHVSHSAMVFAPSVAREVCAFLRSGHFTHQPMKAQ